MISGCVIIGYQGIGKSTLSNDDMRYVDLESGSFYVDGYRQDNWYIIYCNIAINLSKQGYNVFVSSHKVVRDYLLSNHRDVKILCCYPSPYLKDDWIQKLRSRYDSSKLDKDRKAYLNALDRYSDNVIEIRSCGAVPVEIDNMNYDLKTLVDKAISEI